MIKRILLALLAVVVVVLAYAAMQPDSFRVERSIEVKAPPAKLHALVDDFRQWQGWSPWEKLDPGMTRTHQGAPAGKGAVYAWSGNSKVGSGRMEILDSSPPDRVKIQLDFVEPFAARNTAEFSFKSQGDVTRVTWAMFGPSPFVSKLMQVFFSMDRMVGKDFEAGLANMKVLAEKP